MADIALLMAEDFERRVRSREGRRGRPEFWPAVAVSFPELPAVEAKIAGEMVSMKEEVTKRAAEPGSSLDLSAVNGFFSA
ncbi:hypothetical protein KSP40_PGU012369 [Platanthera guangdongensis]|uniref:Uncharacterized protein n=1 Tax=Platanthera guangdongensis TaxID=2320717 RepID=A0ABR2N4D5_9ASPA